MKHSVVLNIYRTGASSGKNTLLSEQRGIGKGIMKKIRRKYHEQARKSTIHSNSK